MCRIYVHLPQVYRISASIPKFTLIELLFPRCKVLGLHYSMFIVFGLFPLSYSICRFGILFPLLDMFRLSRNSSVSQTRHDQGILNHLQPPYKPGRGPPISRNGSRISGRADKYSYISDFTVHQPSAKLVRNLLKSEPG